MFNKIRKLIEERFNQNKEENYEDYIILGKSFEELCEIMNDPFKKTLS